MRTSRIALSLVALFLAPSALAGSASAPEVTDLVGDVTQPYLDISTAWISHDASYIYFTLHVDDTAGMNPADNGDAAYKYRFNYRASWFNGQQSSMDEVRLSVWHVDSDAAAGQPGTSSYILVLETGIGTTATGTYSIDHASDTLTLKLRRNLYQTGTVFSGITVTTELSKSAVATGALPNAAWAQVDTAAAAAATTYTVS